MKLFHFQNIRKILRSHIKDKIELDPNELNKYVSDTMKHRSFYGNYDSSINKVKMQFDYLIKANQFPKIEPTQPDQKPEQKPPKRKKENVLPQHPPEQRQQTEQPQQPPPQQQPQLQEQPPPEQTLQHSQQQLQQNQNQNQKNEISNMIENFIKHLIENINYQDQIILDDNFGLEFFPHFITDPENVAKVQEGRN